jgi:hypothetical protein
VARATWPPPTPATASSSRVTFTLSALSSEEQRAERDARLLLTFKLSSCRWETFPVRVTTSSCSSSMRAVELCSIASMVLLMTSRRRPCSSRLELREASWECSELRLLSGPVSCPLFRLLNF